MARYETPVTVRGVLASLANTIARTLDVSGRSRRSDVIIFIAVSQLVSAIAADLLGRFADWDDKIIARLLIENLIFLPFYALFARRCHDQGRSGWWALILPPLVASSAYTTIRVNFHAADAWFDLGWWGLPLILCAITMLAFIFWPPAEGGRFGPDPRIALEPVTS